MKTVIKSTFISTTLFILLAGATGALAETAPAEVEASTDVVSLIDGISKDRVKTWLDELSGATPVMIDGVSDTITNRHTFSDGSAKAEKYLEKFFTDLGLTVEKQTFTAVWGSRETEAVNLVIELPGPADNGYFLITAHYDSTASFEDYYSYTSDPAPGADDNGSGIVAAMLIAELFAQKELSGKIRLVLYSGEEQGLLGSRDYARHLAEAGDKITGIINIDMIAPEPYAEAQYLPIFFQDHGRYGMFDPGGLADLFAAVSTAYNFNIMARPHWGAIIPNSDHFPMWYTGFDTVFLNHGSVTDGYHRFTDLSTEESIDYDYLVGAYRIIAAVTAHAVGYSVDRFQFRRGAYLAEESEPSGGCSTSPETTSASAGLIALALLIAPILIGFRKRISASRALNIIIGLVIISAAVGCAPEDEGESQQEKDRKHAKALVDEGKQLLIEQNRTEARRAFRSAVEEYDPNNLEAGFGAALTDLLDVIELLNMLFAYSFGPDALREFSPLHDVPADTMALYAAEVLQDMEAAAMSDVGLLSACEQDDFMFDLSGLPMRLLVGERLDLDLELNSSDACLLRAFWQTIAALASFLNAHSLDAPIMKRYDQTDGSTNGYISYINMAVSLFGDSPNFLTLTDDGAQKMEQTRSVLEGAFADLAKMFKAKRKEKSLEKSLLVYDEDSDGEYLKFGGVSADQSAKNSTLTVTRIGVSDELIEAMERASESFGGGARFNLSPDLLLIVMPIIDILTAIMVAGPGLDDSGSTISFDTLINLIPNYVELDFGAFFGTPVSLRQLAPPYKNSTVFAENVFLMEWECVIPDTDPDGYPGYGLDLSCSDGATLTDSDHFTDQVFTDAGIDSIPADGIESPAAYVPLPDPTLNGLLYINMYLLGFSEYENAAISPDLYELNLALSTIGGILAGL